MMVNSNVPRYSNLASQLHRNYFFKFKLVLSSFRSNTHMSFKTEENEIKTHKIAAMVF